MAYHFQTRAVLTENTMRTNFLLNLFIGFCISVMIFPNPAFSGNPEVVYVDEDPKMNVAINEARRHLPELLKHANEPKAEVHRYAVRITLYGNNGAIEHLWVYNPRHEYDNIYSGAIDQLPKLEEHIPLTGRIKFHYNQMTDWAIFKDKQSYGQFTSRVTINKTAEADPENAKAARKFLSPDPIPNDWYI